MTADYLAALTQHLADEPAVRFGYLFGSRARGDAGPRSDVDVAVSLDPDTDAFDFRLRLLERLMRLLRTDRVDLVILNTAPILLRQRVVRDGRVVKDDPVARVRFEARTISEYLDTQHLRDRHLRPKPPQAAAETADGG